MKKQIYLKWICLVFIFVGFIITRFWRLTVLPGGIHLDEAGMAYDAWCLVHYGVDRYLKSWPVYFLNYGGGQNALYTYLCMVCMKIMGFNMWSIRLPGVLSSLLIVVFGMKIAKRVFSDNIYLPYVVGGLAVICPYFIMASRFGLESNLALGFSTMFLYFFIRAVEDGKTGYYVLAGLSGGILLYTYALTYIFVPVFLLLSFCYLLWTKRLVFRKWLIMAVPLGILAFPLILVQLVNMLDLEEMRLGIFTITKLDFYRVYEIGEGKTDFLRTLSCIFCGDDLAYNSVPGGSTLYKISIALFVLGAFSTLAKLFLSLYKRRLDTICFPAFWFLSILCFTSQIITNVNRVNAIFLVVVIMIVEGIKILWDVKGKLRYLLAGLLGAAYLVCFLGFANYYYGGQYNAETYPITYFDIRMPEAVEFIEADKELREKRTYMAEPDIYFLISVLLSPYELEIMNDSPCYGNYYFHMLGEIEEDCNYIVRDIYTEYKEELLQNGFQEIVYTGYSLFYRR